MTRVHCNPLTWFLLAALFLGATAEPGNAQTTDELPPLSAVHAPEAVPGRPSITGEPTDYRWWIGFDVGLANPTSDLGKVTDSGPLFLLALGRELSHPLSVQVSLTHAALERGGIPESVLPEDLREREGFPTEPFGPDTDLWILAAGPSVDLTPPGRDAVDFVVTGCLGITFWDVGPSELNESFTDNDPTGCLFMDALVNLGNRTAVGFHFDGYLIRGGDGDGNLFRKEFLHGFGTGLRFRL